MTQLLLLDYRKRIEFWAVGFDPLRPSPATSSGRLTPLPGGQGPVQRLALDEKNHVLFAACANSGNPPAQPAQPMMVILKADDDKILTSLPLAGGSDGAEFNPSTMEAFSTHGNGRLTVVKEKSPTSFEVEQNLETMNGAPTITLDRKTNHIFDDEPGAWSSATATTRRPPRTARHAVPGSFTILMIGK